MYTLAEYQSYEERLMDWNSRHPEPIYCAWGMHDGELSKQEIETGLWLGLKDCQWPIIVCDACLTQFMEDNELTREQAIACMAENTKNKAMKTEELINQIEQAREQIRQAVTELVKEGAFQVAAESEDIIYFDDIMTLYHPSRVLSPSIALTVYTDLDEATASIADKATTSARHERYRRELEATA